MGYVLALAVGILQQVEGFDKYDKMIEGLTNVFEAAENAANSARKSAKEFAEKYKDAPVVYVMSSGVSMEVAYSTSICLMMEMQDGSTPAPSTAASSSTAPSRSWIRTCPSSC